MREREIEIFGRSQLCSYDTGKFELFANGLHFVLL